MKRTSSNQSSSSEAKYQRTTSDESSSSVFSRTDSGSGSSSCSTDSSSEYNVDVHLIDEFLEDTLENDFIRCEKDVDKYKANAVYLNKNKEFKNFQEYATKIGNTKLIELFAPEVKHLAYVHLTDELELDVKLKESSFAPIWQEIIKKGNVYSYERSIVDFQDENRDENMKISALNYRIRKTLHHDNRIEWDVKRILRIDIANFEKEQEIQQFSIKIAKELQLTDEGNYKDFDRKQMTQMVYININDLMFRVSESTGPKGIKYGIEVEMDMHNEKCSFENFADGIQKIISLQYNENCCKPHKCISKPSTLTLQAFCKIEEINE